MDTASAALLYGALCDFASYLSGGDMRDERWMVMQPTEAAEALKAFALSRGLDFYSVHPDNKWANKVASLPAPAAPEEEK